MHAKIVLNPLICHKTHNSQVRMPSSTDDKLRPYVDLVWYANWQEDSTGNWSTLTVQAFSRSVQ
ncbi:hypothetical protein EJB05_22382, partial [Eragrostis curvula]